MPPSNESLRLLVIAYTPHYFGDSSRFSSQRRDIATGLPPFTICGAGRVCVLRSHGFRAQPSTLRPSPDHFDRATASSWVRSDVILDTFGRTDVGTLLLGFDSRLRRCVWLHELPVNTPSVSSRIRDLNRPGRLRWLGARRTSNEELGCLRSIGRRAACQFASMLPPPWRVVRQWLADLAREIDAALADGFARSSYGRSPVDHA